MSNILFNMVSHMKTFLDTLKIDWEHIYSFSIIEEFWILESQAHPSPLFVLG